MKIGWEIYSLTSLIWNISRLKHQEQRNWKWNIAEEGRRAFSHWVAIFKRFPFWLKDLSPSLLSTLFLVMLYFFCWKEIARRVAQKEMNWRRGCCWWGQGKHHGGFCCTERDEISFATTRKECMYIHREHSYLQAHALLIFRLSCREREH